MASSRPKVVIVGGGFGGLTCAQALASADVDVLVVDRRNHHLFQPLLYQVAICALSPAEIAAPIRSVLSRQKNARVVLGEVVGIDTERRELRLTDEVIAYDYAVLAAGASTSYFGHDEWEAHAPGLKSIEDATEVRRRVLTAFERAERTDDAAARAELLTFVVVGGGPTGVELAGAIAELSRFVLAEDFRRVNPQKARVVLLEGGPRVLATFSELLSARAREQLDELGVEVRTGTRVVGLDEHGVEVEMGDARGADAVRERIAASTIVWGAGVRASELGQSLGVPLAPGGRVPVGRDCSVTRHPEVFVIGDMAAFTQDERLLPGVSPVAMQQARHVARCIEADRIGGLRTAFRYVDKGSMATIGRSRAIASSRGLELSGLLAWLAWLFIHVWYLIGFRSRFVVLFTWAWSYFVYKRGARLITRSTWPEGGRPAAPLRGDAHVVER